MRLPKLSDRSILYIELVIIFFFSVIPLLIDLPYRVNINLTWEGAYRMYIGQFPYKDFGSPIGYGFWVIPFIFFKIFGPYLYSLLLAQAFINLTSLLCLRAIFRQFGLRERQTLIATLVLCLSFVMLNFWPWYNHTVFVFELFGLYFLVRYMITQKKIIFLGLSAFFIALSLFTKQDGGGLALMLCLGLLVSYSFLEKEIKSILIFLGFYGIALAILIGPLLQFDFGYWFNYGQSPHFSRINAYDFLSTFFQESHWIKFYLGAIVITLLLRYKTWSSFFADKNFLMFTLFTLGILVQAIIIQVTSFSPPTGNYYFHCFAIAYLLYALNDYLPLERLGVLLTIIALIFFWRSENYWKYSNKLLGKALPSIFAPPPADVVSKGNWSSVAPKNLPPMIWTNTDYRSFRNIKIPENTAAGIDRIMALEVVKKKNLRVLNMSNLSTLAYELHYIPEHGTNFPLWYHRNVAFFDREVKMLCDKIGKEEYDLILFEDMPDVDNFFPYAVRDCALEGNYMLVHRFLAPTSYATDSVEVYIRKPTTQQ